jgi:hypothetical protein
MCWDDLAGSRASDTSAIMFVDGEGFAKAQRYG